MTIDIADLRPWIARRETITDTLWPQPAAAMAALLDREQAPRPGDPLPPLWHWAYFLAMHPQSRIAEDGRVTVSLRKSVAICEAFALFRFGVGARGRRHRNYARGFGLQLRK